MKNTSSISFITMASTSASAPTSSISSASVITTTTATDDAASTHPDFFMWLRDICPADVARYMFEFFDFGLIIYGLLLVSDEMETLVLDILNEKWWIRVANIRWDGYFSKAILEWIYKNIENEDEWERACNFTLDKTRPIYSIISDVQDDVYDYLDYSLNEHLLEEMKPMVDLPLFKLPSNLIPKHEIPTIVQKYLLFRRWKDHGKDSPLKFIPCSFILGNKIKDIILDPADVGDLAEWGNDLPDLPYHPFITWLYYEDAEEGSCLNGFYTGPVYVHEEDWNKDWGILVDDDIPTSASEPNRKKRKTTGVSPRIRKFYWSDPDYFPLVRYEIYQHTVYFNPDTVLKCSDKILELLRTNPGALDGYSYGPWSWGRKDGDFKDGIVRFPLHLLGDINGFSVPVDPSDSLYKYIPNYSEEWVSEISAHLSEAILDSDSHCC